MALQDDHAWLDAGPIPPDLDAPEGAPPDPLAVIEEAFRFAEDSEVSLIESVEMLADVEPERWRINDDESAEWAFRHLAEAEANLEALRLRADAWAEKIQRWFEQAAREPARSAEFWTAHLEWYARRLRSEAGRKSVKLPSGALSTRTVAAAAEIADEEALIAWASENCPELIRIREDVQVSTLREHVALEEPGVVWRRVDLETGEVISEPVPGTIVRPERVSATVKVTG